MKIQDWNRKARVGTVGVVVLGLGALSGCGTTMRDLPLPGTGVSGDTVKIQAEFGDALNLADGAPVKVNGIDMGKVDDITVADFKANATLKIKTDAQVRHGAKARLRYTTPLGEVFVDITNPASGELMKDDDKLTLKETATAPSVEDALAEASLLINGGGLDQLQTVTEEFNAALHGHEGDFRTLLDRASVFLTQANATTSSIDVVLTSLNSLSKTLNKRQGTINRALKQIQPAAKVLREKTPEFTTLLQEIEKFTKAANGTVSATKSQLIRMLQQVEPVLAEFTKNNPVFDRSLQAILNAAGAANEAIATDYLNIGLELHLDGLDAGGLVEGTLAGLLQLLGGNLTNLAPSLLGGDGLIGNLLGGLLGATKPASTKTAGTRPAAGSTTKSGSTTGSGSGSSGGSAPTTGLNGLLGSLLGGGR